MRLTLFRALLLAAAAMAAGTAARAGVGDLLVVEKAPLPAPPDASTPQPAGAGADDAATAEARPDAPQVPFAALYDAPVFGKSNNGSAERKVDESALRYYAAQKNHARVDAETRRLKALYPSWGVPANLYAPAGLGNDEQPLWDLFGAGKLEELRAAVKVREQKEPGWRPSADLMAKLARREASTAIVALSDAKEWKRVLDAASRLPAVLTCSTIDIDWRVAEAFAQVNEPKRAFEVDAAILLTCTNREERLATVRKAIPLLSADQVKALIAMGATLPDGSGEFDAARLDLVRAKIGEAMSEGAPNDVPADGLKLLGDATLRTGDASDAALLGWYYAHVKEWADADDWFKLGMNGTRSGPKLAEGRALALQQLGRLDEAEKIAGAWKDRSANLKALYFGFVVQRLSKVPPIKVDPELLVDFTALVSADKNSQGAQALAWYGFNRKDWTAAATWFERALDWAPDGKPDLKMVEGYALSLQNLGRLAEAEDLAYAHKDLGPELRALFVSVAITELTLPDPAPAIGPEHYERLGEVIGAERSPAGAAALGWRHLRDNDDPAAIEWFKSAIAWWPDGKGDLKTNLGYALALKGAARYAEAEDVSYAWIGGSAEMKETYRGIVTVELTDGGLADQITEPRVARFVALVEAERSSVGAQALGWFRLHQDGCGYAAGWFGKAIAWSPDAKGDVKINEGYAQALQAAGHYATAEDVAYGWADRSADMQTLYIKIVVDALTRTAPEIRVSEPRLDRFAQIVLATRSVNGAQALAWHRYRDAGCGYAIGWFALATAWSPDGRGDAKINEGYASALRDVGRLADAADVLYPWVGRVPLMRDIYLQVGVTRLTRDEPPEPMSDDKLAAFIGVAMPVRSALAAQALGWYRLSRHEYPDGVRWFKLATDWWPPLPADAERKPDEVPEGYRPLDVRLALKPEDYLRTPRAFSALAEDRERQSQPYLDTFGGLARTWVGYAMALRAVGRVGDAEEVAFQWRDRSPSMKRLFVDIAVAELTKPGAAQIAADRLKRYATAIEADRSPAGASALGWYATGRKGWTDAAVWFKAALDWSGAGIPPDAKIVEGYAFALRNAGRTEEALSVAAEWQDRIPSLKALYFDVSLDALQAKDSGLSGDRLAEIMNLVEADNTPRGALALGWYFFNAKQIDKALPRFKAAITGAGDGPVDPKAAEGFALTLRALGRNEDALTFISAWIPKIPSLRDTLTETAADILTHNGGADTLAPDLAARLATIVKDARSTNDAAAFGWYAYAHKDWASAAEWFRDAMAWSPDGRGDAKIAEGYASTLRNVCRYRDAEAIAAPWINDPGAAVRTVYVDTVAERLARQKPFLPMTQPESERLASATLAGNSANGAQALGWYSYNAKQYRAAIAWFDKALGWEATEGTVYGLAMAHRRLKDEAGVMQTIAAYADRFPRLAALRRPGAELTLDDARDRAGKLSECARPRASGARDVEPTAFYAPPPPPDAPRAMPGASDRSMMEVLSPAFAGELGVPPTLPRSRPASFLSAPAPVPLPPGATVDEPGADAAAPAPRSRGRAKAGSAASALAAKDYSRCVSIVMAEEEVGRAGGTETQIKGWCLLGLDRPQEAAIAFRAARAKTSDTKGDSAFGETLSLLRSGDAGAAAAVASQAPLSSDRRQAVGLQVMERRAYDAYQGGRWAETVATLDQRAAYAPETRDLMMLRGYALYHIGDYDAARAVFTMVNRQTADPASQRALALVSGSRRD